MKICITTPLAETFHGGTRLIIDMASELSKYNEVHLLSERPATNVLDVPVIDKALYHQLSFDLVILCSPHSVYVLDDLKGAKCIVFIQMLEHLWLKGKLAADCERFYNSGHETFVNSRFISKHIGGGTVVETWIPDYFFNKYESSKKSIKTILLESPESNNPTKDVDRIALKVATRLKVEFPKLHFIGYGRNRPKKYNHLFDSFAVLPSYSQLYQMYSMSTIMLKATVFDGRACAPLESMLFDVVNVRAIDYGDDHLTVDNCYLSDYNEDRMFELTCHAVVLNNYSKIHRAKQLAQSYTFANFIKQIETKTNLKLYGNA